MQSTNKKIYNVEIEVASGRMFSGGTYELDKLKENLKRFEMIDDDGVVSVQGQDENGNILIWDKSSNFSVIGDGKTYNGMRNLSISDIDNMHVIDKTGEWGHGKIMGLTKNDEGAIRAFVNFPINADQGWEIIMPLSQIKMLPNQINAQIKTQSSEVIGEIDITDIILTMDEEEIVHTIEDGSFHDSSPEIMNRIREIIPIKDKGVSESDLRIECVESVCSFFAKEPEIFDNEKVLPASLIDDSIQKQVNILFEEEIGKLRYNPSKGMNNE
jgi:hypothetical protein